MASKEHAGAGAPQSGGPLSLTGRAVYESLTFVGELFLLLLDSLARMFRRPFEVQETLKQMAFIGASSVPIVVLTTFSSGAVLSLYSADLLVSYGASSLAGATVGLALCREIAPVLAGIMVAARCGSAMAAQIGSMAVTEQIDALRSLNVAPTGYLVVPRLVASVTMLPVLCMVGIFSGVYGGYLVSVKISGVASGTFMDSLRQFVEPADIQGGMIKTVVFGLLIGLVACQQGLRTQRGAVGVGEATTRTVVITMVLIYVVNYFMTLWLFG